MVGVFDFVLDLVGVVDLFVVDCGLLSSVNVVVLFFLCSVLICSLLVCILFSVMVWVFRLKFFIFVCSSLVCSVVFLFVDGVSDRLVRLVVSGFVCMLNLFGLKLSVILLLVDSVLFCNCGVFVWCRYGLMLVSFMLFSFSFSLLVFFFSNMLFLILSVLFCVSLVFILSVVGLFNVCMLKLLWRFFSVRLVVGCVVEFC